MESKLCEICQNGHTIIRCVFQQKPYRGINHTIPLYFAVCNNCGSEQADEFLAHQNKLAMLNLEKDYRIERLIEEGTKIQKENDFNIHFYESLKKNTSLVRRLFCDDSLALLSIEEYTQLHNFITEKKTC